MKSESPIKAKLWFMVPLAVFVVMSVYFAIGLTKDPKILPSVLINQQVPPFDLKPILGSDRGFSSEDLKGQVSLVNIFGSWCVACLIEHPFLMKLKTDKLINVYGIDWREKTPEAGPNWLRKNGDPYTLVGDDPESRAAIAFGVYGAPETFVVDKQGIIRYKHVGPIGAEVWNQILSPIIKKLRQQ